MPGCPQYGEGPVVTGCSRDDCKIPAPKCEICKINFVERTGDFCLDCDAECIACHKHVHRGVVSPAGHVVCFDCLVAYSDENSTSGYDTCQCGNLITKKGDNFCSTCLERITNGICTECGLPLGSGIADEHGRCEGCNPMWSGGSQHSEYLCACGVKPAAYHGQICPDCTRNLGDDEVICPYCKNNKMHHTEVACESCLEELQPCPMCEETLISKGAFLCPNCLREK